jgi:CcmD family protein
MIRVGKTWRTAALWMLLLVASAASVPIAAQQQAPPPKAAQDEFVPIDQLPPTEQLPAAPLLIAAYSVAWLLVAGYLFSIWRRIGRVEHELADANRRLQHQRRP